MTDWMEMGIVRGSDGLEGGRTVDLLEIIVGWRLDDVKDGDDLCTLARLDLLAKEYAAWTYVLVHTTF